MGLMKASLFAMTFLYGIIIIQANIADARRYLSIASSQVDLPKRERPTSDASYQHLML